VRGKIGGASQVEKLAARLDDLLSIESVVQLGYEVPGPERRQYRTIHVSAK
jgi:hypothetical protein